MSAAGAMRTARWRRWLSSVPVIVALLFATTTVAATVTPDAGPPATSAHLMAVQFLPSAQQAAGHRPDVPTVERAATWTAAPGVGTLAWVPARSGTDSTGWWHRRQDVTGHLRQTRHETYRGRGPPGRRTPHALS